MGTATLPHWDILGGSGLFIYLYCETEIATSKEKKNSNPLNSPIGGKGNGTWVNMS